MSRVIETPFDLLAAICISLMAGGGDVTSRDSTAGNGVARSQNVITTCQVDLAIMLLYADTVRLAWLRRRCYQQPAVNHDK